MSFDKASEWLPEGADAEKKNPLVKMVTCGNVRLSIFENDRQQSGEAALYYTVKVSRSYRDGAGKWQSTSSFYKSHLPQLIYACQRALAFVEDVESEAAAAPPF
jgi:hypothetical protein